MTLNLKKQLPLRVSPETYDRIVRLSYAPHGQVPTARIVHQALELGLAQLEAQTRPTIPPNTDGGPVSPLTTRGGSDAA